MLAESFWEVMFDNLHQGIYVLDHAGRYIYCNRAFLQMVGGASREDILQLNAFRLVPEGQVRKSVGVAALEQKKPLTMINTVITPRGYHYRQMATATPIFDDMGAVVYVLVETTLLETLERQFQNALLVEDRDYADVYPGNAGAPGPVEVVAESPAMRALLEMARQLAQVDTTVLLTGETGTGKEVVAQYLHRHSRRARGDMVEINCAALPENLLEAELFGYEKGAFTGALNTGKPGLVEKAQGGTLFLDEVNSLPLALQGKLLRLLETRRSKRLGALEEKELDFRLICATNQDLREQMEQGNFRSDLYYRLSVVPITLPPLRERREDIVPLALHFLEQFCRQYGRTKVFAQGVLDQLQAYDWPGNVRELRNVVERLLITSTADAMEIRQAPDHLISGSIPSQNGKAQSIQQPVWHAAAPAPSEGPYSLEEYVQSCERQAIADALARCGTTYKAAECLGVNQSTIVRKKQKYGL